MSEAARSARFVLPPEGPLVHFLAAVDEPADLQPPGIVVRREPQLTERDAHLRGPAIVVNARCGLPDWIPARVAARTADADVIRLRPRWVDDKERAAQVIVVSVKHHREHVGVEVVVTTHKVRLHTCAALAVVQFRPDVEGRAVEKKTHLGALRRRLTFVWIYLREFRDGRRRAPGDFVQPPVHGDRRCALGGSHCGYNELVSDGWTPVVPSRLCARALGGERQWKDDGACNGGAPGAYARNGGGHRIGGSGDGGGLAVHPWMPRSAKTFARSRSRVRMRRGRTRSARVG